MFNSQTLTEDDDESLGFTDDDVIDFDTKASTGAVNQAQRKKQDQKSEDCGWHCGVTGTRR